MLRRSPLSSAMLQIRSNFPSMINSQFHLILNSIVFRLFDECEAYFKVDIWNFYCYKWKFQLCKWDMLNVKVLVVQMKYDKCFSCANAFVCQVKCIDLLVNNAGINTNLGWRKCMEVSFQKLLSWLILSRALIHHYYSMNCMYTVMAMPYIVSMSLDVLISQDQVSVNANWLK